MSSERGGSKQEREHGGGQGGASAGRGMGLAKSHTITHPTLGQREITQAEWKAQHQQLRSEGWTRQEGIDDEPPSNETTGPVGETSSGELQQGTIASDVAPPYEGGGASSGESGQSGAGESTSTT